MLVISGRTRNVLNLGGEKISPERVEAVLSMHPNIAQCAVIAAANELGVDELTALVIPRSYLDSKALDAFCKTNLPAAFAPTRFISVADLPRNEMGKIDRVKLARLLGRKLN